MATIDHPYTPRFRALKRKLVRYKWSAEELRWLASLDHADWPQELISLLHTKLAAAEQESHESTTARPGTQGQSPAAPEDDTQAMLAL